MKQIKLILVFLNLLLVPLFIRCSQSGMPSSFSQVPTQELVTQAKEVSADSVFSQARFLGSSWGDPVKSNLEVGSLFSSTPLRYGNVDQIVFTCQSDSEKYHCNSQSWQLSITSLFPQYSFSEAPIPKYNKSEKILPNHLKETIFTFETKFGEVDKYNIQLASQIYIVNFKNVINLPADCNGDLTVSQSDFNIFKSNYLVTNLSFNSCGDFDGDGIVSQSDYNHFHLAYLLSLN